MRRENKFKLLTMTTLAALSLSLPCFADGLIYDVSVNLADSKVIVEVEADAGDIVSLLVLPEDITLDQLAANPSQKGSAAVYVRNEVAEEDNKVSFSFPISSGKYTLNLTSNASQETVSPVEFVMPDKDDYATFISYLKNLDKDTFVNTVKIEDYKDLLGFDIDIYTDKAVERFYDEYKNSLSDVDYDNNLSAFKKCAVIEAINTGVAFDTADFIKVLYKDDTVLMGYINKHITSSEAESFYNARMESASGKNIKNIDDLLITAKEAAILTAVKYPIEDDNIRVIMTEYKDILGLNKVTTAASIYRALSGNTYQNTDTLVSAYETALASGQTTGSTGGGGGGGGGASSKPDTSKVTPESSEKINSVALPSASGQTGRMEFFNDIASVEWAKEAIDALYKAGVVSGKEEGKFYPQDNVLREEFVKMLVATFNIKLVGADMPFADVNKDAWYYDYVRTAYIAGAVSGMNESEFGIGQKISRQDICVMSYRMMAECDVTLPEVNEKAVFADDSQIADYAKEAVSALQMAGIINGSEGKFNPRATATRAETARIMHGILNLLEGR